MLHTYKQYLKESYLKNPHIENTLPLIGGVLGGVVIGTAGHLYLQNKLEKRNDKKREDQFNKEFNEKNKKYKTYADCNSILDPKEKMECKHHVAVKHAVKYQYSKRNPNEYYS